MVLLELFSRSPLHILILHGLAKRRHKAGESRHSSIIHQNAFINPEATQTPGLQRLPYEMLTKVVWELSLETVFDLAQTCHHFQYLVREAPLCKMLLKLKAPFSPEATEALEDGLYDRALRRLVKRRRAFSQASPYMMGIVGVADSYIYCDGCLLYVSGDLSDRRLHILDLRNATNEEVVVYIPELIPRLIPDFEIERKYTFRTLYHAFGVTSGLLSYARPVTSSWLVIFNAHEQRLIGKIELDSTIRLFVRNNKKCLIYGTHSAHDASENRKWVLHLYNIESQSLSPAGRIIMSDLVGYEIGSTVCLEIFDNFLYGCSNQTLFELQEIDWTSFYYCFRVSLDRFNRESIEIMHKRDAFRRQHREGPIDDRWTFLTLDRDEATGAIKLTECRREWPNGGSENRRTYYFMNAKFATAGSGKDGTEDTRREDDGNDPWPDEPLALLVRDTDRPNFFRSSERQFHPGDFGRSMFNKSKTYLSAYSHSCDTFLDLVDDPDPCHPETRRLRIRTGHRICHPPAPIDAGNKHTLDGKEAREATSQNESNRIAFWPPDLGQGELDARAEVLRRIYRAMNPAGLCGSITAMNDCRTVVYATGNGGGGSSVMNALIVLSFDPAFRMAGMSRVGSTKSHNVDRDAKMFQHKRGSVRPSGNVERSDHHPASQYLSHDDVESTTKLLRCQVETVLWSDKQNLQSPAVGIAAETPWVQVQQAMHHDIGAKYDFSYFGGDTDTVD